MFELNEEQISLVTSDVENAGINYSHLSYDLIDHVCCDIELHMSQGIPFNQAYNQVKEEFGIKGLRQIQQDTLMLIDKNYRIMKKSMKMIGVIAMSLMAFGVLFKIFHLAGAAIMLLVSFFFTAAVFFPTLLYVIYKEVNQKKQAIIYITAFLGGLFFMAGVLFKILHWPEGNLLFFLGLLQITYLLIPMLIILRIKHLTINKSVFLTGHVSLMIFLTGLIFKIQHWPGANILLSLGSIVLVMIFIPMFYYKDVRKSDKIRTDFIFGIITLTYFIVFTFLLSFSQNDYSLLEFNSIDKSYQENANFLINQNQIIQSSLSNQYIINLSNQANMLHKEMQELKVKIIQHHTDTDKETAIKILKTNNPLDNKEKTTSFLLSEAHYRESLQKLKNNINAYHNLYAKIIGDSLMNQSLSILLKAEDLFIYPDGHEISWERHHFYQIPSAAALYLLSLWQYNLRLAENALLSALINNPQN